MRVQARRVLGLGIGTILAASSAAACTPLSQFTLSAATGASSQPSSGQITARASDDGYVQLEAPNRATGSAAKLVASAINGMHKTSYLKFALPALPAGASVTSARLDLTATTKPSAPVRLHSVVSNGWVEGTLTYASRPAVGPAFASVNAGISVASFDVSKRVVPGRTVSFAVTADSGVAVFVSDEAGAAGPKLVVNWKKSATTPTPAATPVSPPKPTVSPAPSAGPLIVGSFTNTTAGSTTQSFVNLRAAMPGLRVRRAFFPGMPTSLAGTEAAGDAAAGIVTFMSVKPSYTSVGCDNARIASLAKSMPAGSYLTAWHEPENDMSGSQYVTMFRNFYKVAKAANPNIYIGNVYMTYQWGAGRKVTNPDAWWAGSGATDFLATDTYMDTWQAGAGHNPKPLAQDLDHLRWHNWAMTKGKPLLLTESGVGQGFTDVQRAAYYTANEGWLRANGYRMLLPWNGAGTPPNGESWDFWGGARSWPQTAGALKAIASRGQPNARL